MEPEVVTATWTTWEGDGWERFHLRWENGGWTADGVVAGADVQYVVRLDEDWSVRQFLLFRDLDEPDLWLVTDGTGRWAEMNGEVRPELRGCRVIDLACTPFTSGLAALTGRLEVGHRGLVRVAEVDPETLAVRAVERSFERLDEQRWLHDGGTLQLDEHRLVVDHEGFYRRAR